MSGAPVTVVPPPPVGPGPDGREPLSSRRPVSTFVALLALAALVLGVLAFTGAAAPRLRAPGWGSGTVSPGEAVWSLELANEGWAPVEVEAVTWPVHGAGEVEVQVEVVPRSLPAQEWDAAQPFAPFTLGGGETRVLLLRGIVTCPPGSFHASVEVGVATLRVRSALGRRHEVQVGPGPRPGYRGTRPGPGAGERWGPSGLVESVPCP